MVDVVIPSTGELVKQDPVDPRTGEVMPQRLTTNQALHYRPTSPVELEFIIVELGETLDRAQAALGELYDARYTAETAYLEKKALAYEECADPTVTGKRMYAERLSLAELRALNTAKAHLHAAEALERAVRSKLFGYLNLNNSQTAAFNAGGFQRH